MPGTVIGVAYVLAFNVPPIEITGTAMIIVLCFVFRNMPVGVRAGMAAMSQIDRSLDEASLTLRGRAPQTLRYVVLPLLRPAIVGALVYGFVRAMTTVSAVIFLVTAEYELATTYIILRVINGDYGLAIAYSCAADRADAGGDPADPVRWSANAASAGAGARAADQRRPRVSVEFRERREALRRRRPPSRASASPSRPARW